MPPPMSTMVEAVGDDGANEVETHSSSDNIISAAPPRPIAKKKFEGIERDARLPSIEKNVRVLEVYRGYHLALAAREQYTAREIPNTTHALVLAVGCVTV